MATMHSLGSIVNTKPTTFKRRGLPLESAYPRRFYFSRRKTLKTYIQDNANNDSVTNYPSGRAITSLIGRQRRSEGVSNTRSKELNPGSLPGCKSVLLTQAAVGFTKGAPARDEQKTNQSLFQNSRKTRCVKRFGPGKPASSQFAHISVKQATQSFNEAKSLLVRSFTPHKTQEVDYLSLLRTPHLLAVQDLLQTLNLQGVSL